LKSREDQVKKREDQLKTQEDDFKSISTNFEDEKKKFQEYKKSETQKIEAQQNLLREKSSQVDQSEKNSQEKLLTEQVEKNQLNEKVNQMSQFQLEILLKLNEQSKTEELNRLELEKIKERNLEAKNWLNSNQLNEKSDLNQLISKLIEEELKNYNLEEMMTINFDKSTFQQQLQQENSQLENFPLHTDALDKKLSLIEIELQDVAAEVEQQHQHNQKLISTAMNSKFEEIEMTLQLIGA